MTNLAVDLKLLHNGRKSKDDWNDRCIMPIHSVAMLTAERPGRWVAGQITRSKQ